MPKIHSTFRRLLSCFSAPSAAVPTPPKKRLSTSLRDDIPEPKKLHRRSTTSSSVVDQETSSSSSDTVSSSNDSVSSQVPPRHSKSMVICTFFGHRRSHVWFCVQIDRLSSKPSLLLELSISTQTLIKEMQSGFVRIALESDCSGSGSGAGAGAGSDLRPGHLHSVPVWTLFCNGRKIGFASRRKASGEVRLMLKKMQSMTVGAGVIPGTGIEGSDVMYMRANYEWVVGGADSESYHLISPDDDCPGQDLSVFLFRTRK